MWEKLVEREKIGYNLAAVVVGDSAL